MSLTAAGELLGGASGATAALISAAAVIGQTYMQRTIASQDAKQNAELEAVRSDMQRGMAEFQALAAAASRRRLKAESLEDTMSTLRRPLLASANDLQSRLGGCLGLRPSPDAREPVPFLTSFMARNYGAPDDPRSAADAEYAIVSTLFCFGEFLAVLEVIRTTVSYLSGGQEGALNLLLDAIRFQLSGESPVQGSLIAGEDFHRLKLYAAEMRAIGEVMLLGAADAGGTPRILGYARFLELSGADAATIADDARRAEVLRFQHAFAKLKADLLAVAANPAARPKRRMNMLRVLLMRLIDELDPPARGPTQIELDAMAAEEALWPAPTDAGEAGALLAGASVVAVDAAGAAAAEASESDGRGRKRRRLAAGEARGEALSPDGGPLPPLLLVPAAALPFGGVAAATVPLAMSKRATHMEVVPREDFRWPRQYDATVADETQAGNAAQLGYLKSLYAAMHRTKARGLAGERRRLLGMLELDALEQLQRRVSAARSADDTAAALRGALPPALREDARAQAALRGKLALLARSQQFLRADNLLLQLDSMDATQRMELGGRYNADA